MSGFGYDAEFQEEPLFRVIRMIVALFISMLIWFKKIGGAVLSAILGAMFVAFLAPVFIFSEDTDEENFEFSLQALRFYWAVLGLFFFVFLALGL